MVDRGAMGLRKARVFKIEVDYGQTLEEMIAAGKYARVDNNINERNFPVLGKVKAERELFLLHLGNVVSTDEILVGLDYRGFRPARVEELLALGAQHSAKIEELLALGFHRPELMEEFPGLIVALGSPWMLPVGCRGFVNLSWELEGRCLDLVGDVFDWTVLSWVLAVRKVV